MFTKGMFRIAIFVLIVQFSNGQIDHHHKLDNGEHNGTESDSRHSDEGKDNHRNDTDIDHEVKHDHRDENHSDEDPHHHEDDQHSDDHHHIEQVDLTAEARIAIGSIWGFLQAAVIVLNLVLLFTILYPTAKQFHKPTFAIIASRAVSDVILMIAPLVQAPWSTVNGHLLVSGEIGHLALGYMYGVGYWALDTNLMVLSVNRLIAVCWPFKLNELFTWKRTLIVLSVAWLVPILINVYTVLRCALLFSAEGLFWVYTKNHFECDIGVDCAQALCIIFIVVCYVWALVRLVRAGIGHGKGVSKRERLLFAQCLGICTFHVLTTLFWIFILHLGFRNLVFTIIHPITQALDSMIDVVTYIGFNQKFREQLTANLRGGKVKIRSSQGTSKNTHSRNAIKMKSLSGTVETGAEH